MISLNPRSIFQLTVTGFLLVTGILVLALLITIRQLTGLSDRSQQVITQSALAMQTSGVLIEQASAMERNALQYKVGKNAEILKVYADRRKRFESAAQNLSSLALGREISALITELIRNEALGYQALNREAGQNSEQSSYPSLMEITYRISEHVNNWTDQQLSDIRTETTQTQNLLRVQAVLLISFALILAAIFTTLITRPLIQIEQAINQLGRGMYESAIRITGPKDLINLGNLLDWLRNRLGRLEQERTSFLRHVSHELKTPLAAMQESAALLNDGIVGELNDEQKEIIAIQSKSCQRLQMLIDDLLRFNSGSFSVLNAMPQAVKMDKIIEDVFAAHELIIKQTGIHIESRLEKLAVKGNPEQLRVVIDNLFTNAIKYSPDAGRISISLTKTQDGVAFDIQDEGPGIPLSEREKVFEAFYQAGPPLRNFYNGTGLGLAIAQEYIRANGGSIEILDSSKGTHLRLYLPDSVEGEQ